MTIIAQKTAPKPVHPRAVRNHGLFGMNFVKQHMIKDNGWTVESLTDQFKSMSDLLSKRKIFLKMGDRALRKTSANEKMRLKAEIRNGRAKLQTCLMGNFPRVHNMFIHHKDMQRLYRNMPEHLVVENINQRTFAMRKERDRLQYRLDKLKNEYRSILNQCAIVYNRIQYVEAFKLPEEAKIIELKKKIEDSLTRVKTIKTINSAYQKMIQVVRHDEIFYEPILNSLTKDIDDQAKFIEHILHVGSPAITRFREMSEEYRFLDIQYKKEAHAYNATIAKMRERDAIVSNEIRRTKFTSTEIPEKRYVRETSKMLFLKNELTAVSIMIKDIKTATLCSQAREIFPRIKSQVDNNSKLLKKIEIDTIGHGNLEIKMKRGKVYEGTLLNKEGPEEIKRKQIIKLLEDRLKEEEEQEKEIIAYMKNRADVMVEIRTTFWNLNNILWYVGAPIRLLRQEYPTPELKLPLLKFEMLKSVAVPPIYYEEDVSKLVNTVKNKLQRLMPLFKEDMTIEEWEDIMTAFDDEFIRQNHLEDNNDFRGTDAATTVEDDDPWEHVTKPMHAVPTRKQLKQQSSKIVEDVMKKDE